MASAEELSMVHARLLGLAGRLALVVEAGLRRLPEDARQIVYVTRLGLSGASYLAGYSARWTAREAHPVFQRFGVLVPQKSRQLARISQIVRRQWTDGYRPVRRAE